jgi:thioredoxin-dependent peroxiredoxin
MTTAPQQGDPAPEIDLPTEDGTRFRLSDHRGRPVVVYFYPKDDTTGCTREAMDFSARIQDFDAIETLVVGISPDGADSHRRFREKHGLQILLASDEDKQAAQAYDVWKERSMYGRKFMGVERSTFLIDRDGVIARAWRNVKVPDHVEEVLDSARLVAS